MSPRLPADSASRPYEVAIVGNDAVLAALPFRTMQLAHALHACGFDFVVPVSWGEELVAREILRILAERDATPAIFCACPLERARLLAAGSELSPYLVSVASPTVATARFVRALHPAALRITAIGGCPGDDDPAIDARIAALELHALLDAHGVLLAEQPEVFDSVIPPDRRRFFSLPGGCPTPRMLEARLPERRMITITDVAFADELADVLLGGESVLVDLSPRLACTCCGGFASGVGLGGGGRDQILRREPPRAASAMLDLDLTIDLRVNAEQTAAAQADARPGDAVERSGTGSGSLVASVPDSDPSPHTTSRETPPGNDARMAPSADPPGAVDRASGERPRIAVTPAGAVPGSARRRTTPPPSTATATSPSAATTTPAAPRWTVLSDHVGSPDAGGASGSPSLPRHSSEGRTAPPVGVHPARISAEGAAAEGRDAVGAASTAGTAATADPDGHGAADAAQGVDASGDAGESARVDASDTPRLGDVAIPFEPSREGMPPVQEAVSEEGHAWSPPAQATPPAALASDGMEQITDVDERQHRRPRGPVHRFLLARTQSIPRATAGGRRVPRAYARHLSAPPHGASDSPAPTEERDAQLGDAGEPTEARVDEMDDLFATRTDVELRLDVSIEPPVTSLMFVAADPEDDDAAGEADEISVNATAPDAVVDQRRDDATADGPDESVRADDDEIAQTASFVAELIVANGGELLDAEGAERVDAASAQAADSAILESEGGELFDAAIAEAVRDEIAGTLDAEIAGNTDAEVTEAADAEVANVAALETVETIEAIKTIEAIETIETIETIEARGSLEASPEPWTSDVDGAATVDASATSAPDSPMSGAIVEDVLARVRERSRAPARVVSRELPAPRPSREPGSLAVFIASAVLVVALLVALAVIFRRAPTAPW